MNNGINTLSIALVGLIFLLGGCSKGNNIPNVDHISPDFEIVRGDEMLASIDSLTELAAIGDMIQAHPRFWDLFWANILPVEPADEPDSIFAQVRMIATDARIEAILDSVLQEYPDMQGLEAEFFEAFQYFEYYFPGNQAPTVYTLISDFGFFPFIFEDDELRDGVGISLEMFLGSDFPYQMFAGDHAVFSSYLTRAYNRDHIVKRTLEVVIDDLMGPPPGDRLIDVMMHNGKRLYILDKILPEHPDSIVFEFTPAQLEWIALNERNLWAHYLTEDLLYSNEFSEINKLVNHSPRVPGLPAEAPGRVANWSGYKIVSAFMARNENLDLIDLISIRDGQQILEAARYRPR